MPARDRQTVGRKLPVTLTCTTDVTGASGSAFNVRALRFSRCGSASRQHDRAPLQLVRQRLAQRSVALASAVAEHPKLGQHILGVAASVRIDGHDVAVLDDDALDREPALDAESRQVDLVAVLAVLVARQLLEVAQQPRERP